MKPLTFLIIPADPALPLRLDNAARDDELGALQQAVGGYVEAIGASQPVTLWCNEDGKAMGLRQNLRATDLWARLLGAVPADTIVGDVVLTGGTDATGCSKSVPQVVVNAMRAEIS